MFQIVIQGPGLTEFPPSNDATSYALDFAGGGGGSIAVLVLASKCQKAHNIKQCCPIRCNVTHMCKYFPITLLLLLLLPNLEAMFVC